MKIFILLIVLFSGCASNTIYRECKQVGVDSNGKGLYDSCKKLD